MKQNEIWGLFREAQQSKSSFDIWGVGVLLNVSYMYSDVFLMICRHIVLEQTTSHGRRGAEQSKQREAIAA